MRRQIPNWQTAVQERDRPLLAPDSLVDSNMQTGSADNRQASNVYFIGGVSVDQQQRFNSFWDQADEVLEEYGFTEWQGYRTVGIPELVRRILEDVHNNCDLDNDHKEIIVSKIRYFGHSRSSAIKGVEEIQEDSDTRNLCIDRACEVSDHAAEGARQFVLVFEGDL